MGLIYRKRKRPAGKITGRWRTDRQVYPPHPHRNLLRMVGDSEMVTNARIAQKGRPTQHTRGDTDRDGLTTGFIVVKFADPNEAATASVDAKRWEKRET